MDRRLRVLVITNLFPNRADPGFAPFNRQQFHALSAHDDVDVWAVIPWRFGRSTSRGKTKDVPTFEEIEGLPVRHPRYLAIPGVPSLNAANLAARLLPRLLRGPRPEVILAAYAYPDGCAGVLLGQALGIKVVVKCHGSDLNRVPEDLAARLQLRALLPRADRVMVVSQKLGEAAQALGVPAQKLALIYNGVDKERFAIRDKGEARRTLGLGADQEVVLYVGHLAEHKGAADLVAALPSLVAQRPKVQVVFVGDGPLKARLQAQASPHLLVVGRVPHAEVPRYLAAADLLCLPSWDEGLPNVVREAHAAGRPVVATRVGGIPEAVHDPLLGRLVEPRQPEALAQALAAQLAGAPASPEQILAHAQITSWPESGRQLHQLLLDVVEGGA